MELAEAQLPPVGAPNACLARARSRCRRAAVLDLGWPSRAQVVPLVSPQAALPREPLELRRFARTLVESSLISPCLVCHVLFQAEYLECLARRHQPAIPMACRLRRVCRGVYLFQLAELERLLLQSLIPVGCRPYSVECRAYRAVCLFQSALSLRLVKSPGSGQRLAPFPLAKPHLRPALSRRRVSGAEYSLDSRS